jgi:hypothetical protein
MIWKDILIIWRKLTFEGSHVYRKMMSILGFTTPFGGRTASHGILFSINMQSLWDWGDFSNSGLDFIRFAHFFLSTDDTDYTDSTDFNVDLIVRMVTQLHLAYLHNYTSKMTDNG